jgi:hypothetical protein
MRILSSLSISLLPFLLEVDICHTTNTISERVKVCFHGWVVFDFLTVSYCPSHFHQLLGSGRGKDA